MSYQTHRTEGRTRKREVAGVEGHGGDAGGDRKDEGRDEHDPISVRGVEEVRHQQQNSNSERTGNFIGY